MRITLESGYALRLLTALSEHQGVVGAGQLAEETAVTTRFTLKILRKLVKGNFISSYKGVHGGYTLKMKPEDITLRSVIELIDGPIVIARCLETSECCSLNYEKTSCIYHHIFETISTDVAEKLEKITIQDVASQNFSLS